MAAWFVMEGFMINGPVSELKLGEGDSDSALEGRSGEERDRL